MNTIGAILSQGCLQQLYLLNRCDHNQPVLQMLDFQQSEANDKEIIIRVSDGSHFLDCTLSGNYQITAGCISQTKNATTLTIFKKMHFIRLVDYFSKLDQTKICRLKIIIRKLAQVGPCQDIVGNPEEIQQFMLKNKRQPLRNGQYIPKPIQEVTIKKVYNKEDRQNGGSEQTSIKLQNIYPPIDNTQYVPYSQNGNGIAHSNNNNHKIATQIVMPITSNLVKTKKEVASASYNEHHGLGQPLTLGQILSGKEGFLIGRLIRFKKTKKQTKDGPMTVCYLGVLDKNQQLIRIHLAGRLAMNNQKTLQKNKCYYIRGFDLVHVKSTGLQIRLKDKQYKILQIHNQDYIRTLKMQYYHWDHQSEVQNQYLDVIGIVDDIQDKTTYNPNNPNDNKSVIRVVLRNKYKCIRISFWSDQMKTLDSFCLKKNDNIIVEDVRKKQSKYYDFGFESTMIRMTDHPHLMQKFQHLLPQVMQDYQPQNIRQLSKLYQDQPSNSKLRTLTAYLTHCHENNIIYRLCDDCKKKVEKMANQCHECGSQNLVFKYNCRLQFSDSTGSIICILFDSVAYKLIGRTANEISEVSQTQIQQIFEPLFYRPYVITLEDRNQRIIMRSIEPLSQEQQGEMIRDNVAKIRENVEAPQMVLQGGKL